MGNLRHRYTGFTIIELVVVIAVIGILVAITVVGYGAWRKSTIENQVKSELSTAGQAMENARNFDQVYPSTIPSTFTSNSEVSIVLTQSTSDSFCLDGTSLVETSVAFYIDQTIVSAGAESGTCAGRTITASVTATPSSVTATLNTSSQIAMTWGATTNAAGYSAQCASDAGFNSNVQSASTVGNGSTSTTIANLTPGTVYCRVKGTSTGGNGPWSSAVQTNFSITNGLVAWWKLNGNANDTIASANGTVSGAALSAGQNGISNTAYYFDGVDDYIELPPMPSSFGAFSLSVWARVVSGPSATNGIGYILHRGVSQNMGDSLFWIATANSSSLYAGNINGGTPGATNESSITGNLVTWHLFTMTYDGSTRILYIDGVVESTLSTGAITSVTTSNRMGIGATPFNPTYRSAKGNIDDVRIYNRTLSNSEVTALYSAGAL